MPDHAESTIPISCLRGSVGAGAQHLGVGGGAGRRIKTCGFQTVSGLQGEPVGDLVTAVVAQHDAQRTCRGGHADRGAGQTRERAGAVCSDPARLVSADLAQGLGRHVVACGGLRVGGRRRSGFGRFVGQGEHVGQLGDKLGEIAAVEVGSGPSQPSGDLR
ncbi:hypothetical protein [Streptosporangium sp. NPDC049644]|uniref:hypothetical protein n=1 Tax=Streptosporangium sp. NPDC049644 TaxID=3155507 RepID=UPI0034304B56